MLASVQFLWYGSSHFGRAGYAAIESPLALDKIDLSGKTILVTGGNAGLGYAACSRLAAMNADVILVARNEERGSKAVAEIGRDNVRLELCDVSRQQDVAQLIERVKKLDVLVLNAGVLLPDERKEVDGVEQTLATNIVNNVQMIEGFLPVLKEAADPRVILVASGGGMTEPLCKTQEEYDEGKFTGMTAYARTKRMQMALAHRYARKEPDVGFYSMHPGWSETDGVKTSIPGFYSTMKNKFRSVEEGADTMCWLAAAPEVDKATQNGLFFRDRAEEKEHFRFAGTEYSEDEQDQMYAFLKSLIKAKN